MTLLRLHRSYRMLEKVGTTSTCSTLVTVPSAFCVSTRRHKVLRGKINVDIFARQAYAQPRAASALNSARTTHRRTARSTDMHFRIWNQLLLVTSKHAPEFVYRASYRTLASGLHQPECCGSLCCTLSPPVEMQPSPLASASRSCKWPSSARARPHLPAQRPSPLAPAPAQRCAVAPAGKYGEIGAWPNVNQRFSDRH